MKKRKFRIDMLSFEFIMGGILITSVLMFLLGFLCGTYMIR